MDVVLNEVLEAEYSLHVSLTQLPRALVEHFLRRLGLVFQDLVMADV